MTRPGPSPSPRFPSPRALRPRWLGGLSLGRGGLRVAETGRTLTARDITPVEAARFARWIAAVLREGRGRRGEGPAVWFSPQVPKPWHVAWSALMLAGGRIAESPGDADLYWHFEDATVSDVLPGPPVPRINSACTDITKSFVAERFEAAAGYGLALDPQGGRGWAIEKSETNGAHDGRLILCPVPRRPGRAYQRLVVNEVPGKLGWVRDFRTSIVAGRVSHVLEKTRPSGTRFSIHNTAVRWVEPGEVFSSAETALIERFAAAMKLDWAALDVLRDEPSGRIYIVDVNTTDTGPPVDLDGEGRALLRDALCRAMLSLAAAPPLAARPPASGPAERPGRPARAA